MTKRIAQFILISLALTCLAGVCAAQPYPNASGWCEQGNGTNPPTSFKVMKSYPQCTVTVFYAGTTTKPALYSTLTGTSLANPITATTTGSWQFYALPGSYDVQFSGLGISSPFTTRRVSLSAVVSVRDFNARGDGATDDTVAINAAAAAVCTAGGGTLEIPFGTFVIASTVAANPILASCSNMTITGVGTLKIKTGSGSYYAIWGHSGVPISNFRLSYITINMNSANNPVPNSGDVDTYPRIVLHTGNGGSGNTVDHVHVTDVRSEWVFFMASLNCSVTDNLIDNVGGGTVQHDTSLIYTERGSAGSIIARNRIVSSARDAKMSVTGIETHSNVVVANNSIQDMVNGMNITGIDTATVKGVVVQGNSVTGAFLCIMPWSNSSSGATGYGLDGADIGGNYCGLTQRSYTAEGGATTGIVLNAQATLPFANINIHDNVVVFELSSSAADPYDTASFGVGYWDAGGTGGCDGCSFKDNWVVNAPSNAYRFSANGSNIVIQGNTGINFGSNLNTGLSVSFRAGLFLSGGTTPITGLSVGGNVFSDTLATSRMGYGIELATVNTSGITIDGDSISCADVTCASLVKAIGPNTGTQLPLVRATVSVPAAKALPAFALRAGSSIYSMRESQLYTWDGFAYTGFIPHPGTPTLAADCGVGATAGGTDRNGRLTIGTGTITSCTVTFALPFSATYYGSVQLLTAVGGVTFTSRSPVGTVNGFVVGGTNMAGNIFEWSFPLAN